MKILIQLPVLFLFLSFSVLAEKITVFEFTKEEMEILKEKKETAIAATKILELAHLEIWEFQAMCKS